MTYPKANKPKTQEHTRNKNLRICQHKQNTILAPTRLIAIIPATVNIPTNPFKIIFISFPPLSLYKYSNSREL